LNSFGYLDWLFRAIGHPVTWFGRLDILSRSQAQPRDLIRRAASPPGVTALLVIVLVPSAIAFAVQILLWRILPSGLLIAAILATSLLSQKA
jgi:adenosylcobinamide-phosphate synthase